MIGFRVRTAVLGAFFGASLGAFSGGMVTPAAAHGVGGPQATNTRSEILRIENPLPNVHVALVEFGERFTVTNHGSVPVRVVGMNGVTTRTIAAGRTVTWHEHAVHWMGPSEPAVVRSDPEVSHVLIPRWQVRLIAGDDEMVVVGRVVWFPSVSPWPWVGGAVAGMAGVVIALRRGVRSTVLGVLLVAGAVRVIALVQFDPSRWTDGLWREGAAIVGVACLAFALVRARGSSHAALGVSAVIGAMAMLLSAGVVDVTWWALPVLPTSIPSGLDRGLIAVVIACAVPTVLFGMRGLLGLERRA